MLFFFAVLVVPQLYSGDALIVSKSLFKTREIVSLAVRASSGDDVVDF